MDIYIRINLNNSVVYFLVSILVLILLFFFTGKYPAIAPTIAESLDIIANTLDIIGFIKLISTCH